MLELFFIYTQNFVKYIYNERLSGGMVDTLALGASALRRGGSSPL